MKSEKLQEKCALFGIYSTDVDIARLTYYGLVALQHRGQESTGISVSNGNRIKTHKGLGLTTQVYNEKILNSLKGYLTIGHNRYSTSGGLHINNAQPLATPRDTLAFAHNGNLPDFSKLAKFLESKKVSTKGLNDSTLMYKSIKYFYRILSLEDSVAQAFPYWIGAFSVLVMSKTKLVALRDQFGIRPLSIGKV